MEQKLLPKFKISNIEIESFKLNDSHSNKKVKIQFGVGIKPQLFIEENSIKISFLFNAYYEETIYCELLSHMNFEFGKKIKEIVESLDEKKHEAVIPSYLFATLIAIAISTNRGIIFSKTTGTFLEKEYLPIIDPTTFVNTENKIAVMKSGKVEKV